MFNQAEIHSKSISNKSYERKHAVEQLGDYISIIPDREQAWKDLHRLTSDKNSDVRWAAANALGRAFPHMPDKEQAWKDLHRLTSDKNSDARWGASNALGRAFQHVPNKEQAWDDLHKLVSDKNSDVRWAAAYALGRAFPHVPDKEQACEDLHRLTSDKQEDGRMGAVYALGRAFLHVPNKEQAWEDMHKLTSDDNGYVRRDVASVIGSSFQHVLHKEQAWEDMHKLASDEDRHVRQSAANALCIAFRHVPDKIQAWNDLIRLMNKGTESAIGSAFQHVPDKIQAWDDLHNLISDKHGGGVNLNAIVALGSAFQYVPDKIQACDDLHRLTSDEDRHVRQSAANALGIAFQHVPDKIQACDDLHRLTSDEDRHVRQSAANALGIAFQHVPDKIQACDDLVRLTLDDEIDVRIAANHSLGRISIFRSGEARNENEFRKELENALGFFEKASKEVRFFNPSRFCLPFYRSFYTIIFRKDEAEVEVRKHLYEAKKAVGGSESKEKLLEVVENLENALKEAKKVRNFGEMKCELNAYRRYCERAAELLESAEDKAPGATRVVKMGLPIIDNRIKEIIAEIQEKTKELCKQTKDTPLEKLGKNVNSAGLNLLKSRDPIGLEKGFDNLQIALSAICAKMPEELKGEACELLKKATQEIYIEDKIDLINMVVSKISTQIGKGKNMGNIEIYGSNDVKVVVGSHNKQESKISTNSQGLKTLKNPLRLNERKKNRIQYLPELESEICDIFKSTYQKEFKAGASEANSKTLEFLKFKLLDLAANGAEIQWLDIGCGNGRCLHVLDAVHDRKNIRYHGIDCSHKHLDDAEQQAKKYWHDTKIEKRDIATERFDSKYDLVSAVLILHEIDPICLPYALKNMLNALKNEGTLVITDFEGPYEQEEKIVAWSAEEIRQLLNNIGGVKMSIDFVPSAEFPTELGFYRCYVKKPELNDNNFRSFLQKYGNFLKIKKEYSKKKRDELRSQINKRVSEILKRPDIDTKNISEEEIARIKAEIGKEYGIKAHKIRLLTNQILFLDDKINEFESGKRCAGVINPSVPAPAFP